MIYPRSASLLDRGEASAVPDRGRNCGSKTPHI